MRASFLLFNCNWGAIARARLFSLHNVFSLQEKETMIKLESLGDPKLHRPNSNYLEELQLFSWACFPDVPESRQRINLNRSLMFSAFFCRRFFFCFVLLHFLLLSFPDFSCVNKSTRDLLKSMENSKRRDPNSRADELEDFERRVSNSQLRFLTSYVFDVKKDKRWKLYAFRNTFRLQFFYWGIF